jgi:hypothetical protein
MKYFPPPHPVLRGDLTVTRQDLIANHSQSSSFSTNNNSLEIFLSSFVPQILTHSGHLFLSSFSHLLSSTSTHIHTAITSTSATTATTTATAATARVSSSSLELRIHVMDGLNYPLKQKTNVIVQFDLVKYSQQNLSSITNTSTLIPIPAASSSVDIHEEILTTIQTNHSLHPRQLVWDHKLSLPLSANIVQTLLESLYPSQATVSINTTAAPATRYHLKVSLIQETNLSTSPRPSTATVSPTLPSEEPVLQAMVVKDLADILKPLLLTNSTLLSLSTNRLPPYTFSSATSTRQEIVLPLPFEPHLLLQSSPSFAVNSDSCVRLRLGLLLVDSMQSNTDLRAQVTAKKIEEFDRRSGFALCPLSASL